MKRTSPENIAPQKGRLIWTPEEDDALLKVASKKGKKNWRVVAEELKKINGGSKTSKQCRERFRNYVNPELDLGKWKKHEKIVFLLIHKQLGSQWKAIAEFLHSRSDVAIKNCFYSIMRKALRRLKLNKFPSQVVKEPAKLFVLISALELLRREYLPNVQTSSKEEHGERKEKIILDLIKSRKIKDADIARFERKIIAQFKKKTLNAELPIQLHIRLIDIGLTHSQAEELAQKAHNLNEPRLEGIVEITFKEKERAVPLTLPPPEVLYQPPIATIVNYSPGFFFPHPADPCGFFGTPRPVLPPPVPCYLYPNRLTYFAGYPPRPSFQTSYGESNHSFKN